MPLQNHALALSREFAKNCTEILTDSTIQNFSTIFRNPNYVVLALPC